MLRKKTVTQEKQIEKKDYLPSCKTFPHLIMLIVRQQIDYGLVIKRDGHYTFISSYF